MKVHYLLDICKMAERCGDIERQKRALETVCQLFGVDPTQLTNQGIRGQVPRPKQPQLRENAEVVPALENISIPERPTRIRNDVDADASDTVMMDINNFLNEI